MGYAFLPRAVGAREHPNARVSLLRRVEGAAWPWRQRKIDMAWDLLRDSTQKRKRPDDTEAEKGIAALDARALRRRSPNASTSSMTACSTGDTAARKHRSIIGAQWVDHLARTRPRNSLSERRGRSIQDASLTSGWCSRFVPLEHNRTSCLAHRRANSRLFIDNSPTSSASARSSGYYRHIPQRRHSRRRLVRPVAVQLARGPVEEQQPHLVRTRRRTIRIRERKMPRHQRMPERIPRQHVIPPPQQQRRHRRH